MKYEDWKAKLMENPEFRAELERLQPCFERENRRLMRKIMFRRWQRRILRRLFRWNVIPPINVMDGDVVTLIYTDGYWEMVDCPDCDGTGDDPTPPPPPGVLDAPKTQNGARTQG